MIFIYVMVDEDHAEVFQETLARSSLPHLSYETSTVPNYFPNISKLEFLYWDNTTKINAFWSDKLMLDSPSCHLKFKLEEHRGGNWIIFSELSSPQYYKSVLKEQH